VAVTPPSLVDRIFQAFRLLRVNRPVAVSALSHRGVDHLAAFRAGEDLRLRWWLSLTENIFAPSKKLR